MPYLKWDGYVLDSMHLVTSTGSSLVVGPEIWKILSSPQWDELYWNTRLAVDAATAGEIMAAAALAA